MKTYAYELWGICRNGGNTLTRMTYFSVRQHMILFARIKDQSEDFLIKDIVRIMKILGLLEFADENVQNLR